MLTCSSESILKIYNVVESLLTGSQEENSEEGKDKMTGEGEVLFLRKLRRDGTKNTDGREMMARSWGTGCWTQVNSDDTFLMDSVCTRVCL